MKTITRYTGCVFQMCNKGIQNREELEFRGLGCIDSNNEIIPDDSLEAVVREAIEKPVDDILRSDLEKVAKPNTYGNIFLQSLNQYLCFKS